MPLILAWRQATANSSAHHRLRMFSVRVPGATVAWTSAAEHTPNAPAIWVHHETIATEDTIVLTHRAEGDEYVGPTSVLERELELEVGVEDDEHANELNALQL